MTKETKPAVTTAKPLSKYAQKKQARLEAERKAAEEANQEKETPVEQTETPLEVVEFEENPIADSITAEVKPVKFKKIKLDKTDEPKQLQPMETKPAKNKRPKPDTCPDFVKPHMKDIAYIVMQNQHIRRHVSICLINYLKSKDHIDDKPAYVDFLWNKFVVSSLGLRKEYSYSERFFVIALAEATKRFIEDFQKAVTTFCEQENISLG